MADRINEREIETWLERDACDEAQVWLDNAGDLEDAWNGCPEVDWYAWVLSELPAVEFHEAELRLVTEVLTWMEKFPTRRGTQAKELYEKGLTFEQREQGRACLMGARSGSAELATWLLDAEPAKYKSPDWWGLELAGDLLRAKYLRLRGGSRPYGVAEFVISVHKVLSFEYALQDFEPELCALVRKYFPYEVVAEEVTAWLAGGDDDEEDTDEE